MLVVIFVSLEHPAHLFGSTVSCATAAALTMASAIANGKPNLTFEFVISLLLYPAGGSAAKSEQNNVTRIPAYCARCARHFTRNVCGAPNRFRRTIPRLRSLASCTT
jgi:hypothetical protein